MDREVEEIVQVAQGGWYNGNDGAMPYFFRLGPALPSFLCIPGTVTHFDAPALITIDACGSDCRVPLMDQNSAVGGNWYVICGFRRMEDTLVLRERPPESTTASRPGCVNVLVRESILRAHDQTIFHTGGK